MKKFVAKSLLFLLPVILIYAAEIFIIPIQTFCYRGLEALRVYRFTSVLHGYLYPDMNMETTGQGDLGLYTSHAVFKKEHWITDPYGYRTEGTADEHYDVVILGDSFTLSPGTLQENSLAAVLEKKTGLNVYPYATKYFEDFMTEKRFMDSPPKYLVLERIEDNMDRLKPFPYGTAVGPVSDIDRKFIKDTFVVADRIYKSVMFRYARSAAKRFLERNVLGLGEKLPPTTYVSDDGTMLFWGGTINLTRTMEKIDDIDVAIKNYENILREKGIKLIVLPIPSKINVYSEKVAVHKDTGFMEELDGRMAAANIDFVDVKTLYMDARKDGVELYFPDDTHWNETGIEITAEAVAEKIKELE